MCVDQYYYCVVLLSWPLFYSIILSDVYADGIVDGAEEGPQFILLLFPHWWSDVSGGCCCWCAWFLLLLLLRYSGVNWPHLDPLLLTLICSTADDILPNHIHYCYYCWFWFQLLCEWMMMTLPPGSIYSDYNLVNHYLLFTTQRACYAQGLLLFQNLTPWEDIATPSWMTDRTLGHFPFEVLHSPQCRWHYCYSSSGERLTITIWLRFTMMIAPFGDHHAVVGIIVDDVRAPHHRLLGILLFPSDLPLVFPGTSTTT